MSFTCVVLAYIWPELDASAASTRTANLLKCLLEQGYRVELWSHSKESCWTEYWQKKGIPCRPISLNCDSFDHIIRETDPEIVVFDRFIMEEQFSFRVMENCPNAIRILDTQDLHFLRHHREQITKQTKKMARPTNLLDLSDLSIDTYARLLREIASIYRSDFSLIISKAEIQLLQNSFNIPNDKLCYMPICTNPSTDIKDFTQRKDFASLGNFRHHPNLEASLYLIQELWPQIRRQNPKAKLHLAGAYAPKEILEIASKDTSIKFHGQTPSATTFLSNKIALLAPLKFGAGIKGKILDAWSVGTPVLTTTIGAEGYPKTFGGAIEDDLSKWPKLCHRFLSEKIFWEENSNRSLDNTLAEFSATTHFPNLIQKITQTRAKINDIRRDDLVGALLWEAQNRSTKFFSRYLQLKN